MDILVPNYVFSSVYEISPQFLRANGIRGVLLDLDGTLVPRRTKLPPDKLRSWIARLQNHNIAILIVSNNHMLRVGRFCKALGVDYIFWALKPTKYGLRRAVKRLGLPINQLALIGDQIFTDVLCGNRAGITTCYIETLDRQDLGIRVRYRLERRFIHRGRQQMEAADDDD